jgi:hypothetical protein
MIDFHVYEARKPERCGLCAAQPDIPSMRGKDQRAEIGGVSTGRQNMPVPGC